ncbi:Universal stress protein A-like protein [Zea mays]|uniref:Universal stress protein A-like protein n=1 Tax=Zea mays TaxID=4577 RepID=A0A3L6FE07_MAIZE|nr:Universal stress protein A-like protein [Zea mays]
MAAEAEVGSGLAAGEKQRTVVVVAVDDSDHSYHALEWTVRHVAAPGGGVAGGAADLVIVHAKPSPSSIVSFGGPGAGEAIRHVDAGLRKTAEAVVARARRVCAASSARALVEVVEGEPRTVLCSAAEKHRADLLVLGSHGYGAVKRALLGSVSDYCAHHAPCSVMIVKQPTKSK